MSAARKNKIVSVRKTEVVRGTRDKNGEKWRGGEEEREKESEKAWQEAMKKTTLQFSLLHVQFNLNWPDFLHHCMMKINDSERITKATQRAAAKMELAVWSRHIQLGKDKRYVQFGRSSGVRKTWRWCSRRKREILAAFGNYRLFIVFVHVLGCFLQNQKQKRKTWKKNECKLRITMLWGPMYAGYFVCQARIITFLESDKTFPDQ